MRKLELFLVITFAALSSLVATTVAGYLVLSSPSSQSSYPSNWVGQMWQGMGGMMGGNNYGTGTPVQNSAAPFFGIAFTVLVAISAVGIVGLAYFVLLPEIRISQPMTSPDSGSPLTPIDVPIAPISENKGVASSPYESVLKTLTVKERKVVEVLAAHEGKYLQKYIRSETGLSRLQIHRVVARLAERGIVVYEKTGNTNTVQMAKWLR